MFEFDLILNYFSSNFLKIDFELDFTLDFKLDRIISQAYQNNFQLKTKSFL